MKDRIGQEVQVGAVVLTGAAGGRFQENRVIRILRDELVQVCCCTDWPSGDWSKVPPDHFDFGVRSEDFIVDTAKRD